ncbi:hypothetical protein [Nannocystis punicea]|uniref:Uncharacterized protein n=1 Tax=Nannocystis punicea TaxID=2995304 RepID=A0ABY7H7W7_9BACT|nr:hypothetical protein [Nannocystis poenicansa]WAS95134.1 hypothetical protein O0S08_03145 [Nannocystis poenicansa]
MSLQSRGSRKFRVGDEVYAWTIRPRPTDAQAAGLTRMTLAIQRIEPLSPAVLVVDLRVTRCDNDVRPHSTGVHPAMVREMLARALAEGWRPESGRGHRLEFGLIRDRP